MTTKHLKAETWRVVHHHSSYDRATKAWTFWNETVAAGVDRHTADAMLRRLGPDHSAVPEKTDND